MRNLDTEVRYFDSGSFGVPQMAITWGEMVAVLDTALVLGTPRRKILSIKTFSDPLNLDDYWVSELILEDSGHKLYENLSVIQIEGALESSFNKSHRVQKVEGEKVQIAFSKIEYPTKPLDSVPSEELFYTLPSLGFEKAYEGENKAAYKQKDSPKNVYLRVDNSCPEGYDLTWAVFSRVSVITDMNHVDDFKYFPGRLKAPGYITDFSRPETSTGLGESSIYGESKWYQIVDLDTTMKEAKKPRWTSSRPWEIIGDSKTFYFFTGPIPAYYTGNMETWGQRVGYGFGEFNSLETLGNTYNHILISHEAYLAANQTLFDLETFTEKHNYFGRTGNSSGRYMLANNKNSNFQEEHKKWYVTTILYGSLISGFKTGVNLTPYNPSIDFLSCGIRSFSSTEKGTFEGYLRGLFFIGTEIKDLVDKDLFNFRDIYKTKDKSFVILKCFYSEKAGDAGNTPIAFKLNNWE